jgi:hypothetical protein
MTDLYLLQSWEFPRNEYHDELPASAPLAFSSDVEALEHLFFQIVQYGIVDKSMVEDAIEYLALNTSIVLSDWADIDVLKKEEIEVICDWYFDRINDDLVNAGYRLTLSEATTLFYKLFGHPVDAVRVNGNLSDSIWIASPNDRQHEDAALCVSYWLNHNKFEHEFSLDDIHRAEYMGNGQWKMPNGDVVSLMQLTVT